MASPSPGRSRFAVGRSSFSKKKARSEPAPPRATAKSFIQASTTSPKASRPGFACAGGARCTAIATIAGSRAGSAASSWSRPIRARTTISISCCNEQKATGLRDIERIGGTRLKSLEPQIRGSSALFSPCTGIIDSHALMLSYQADVEAAGGTTVFRTPVVAAAIVGRKIELRTGGSEPAELEADLVVNAAGLDAWDFSAGLSGLDRRTIPPKYLAKGNYFTLTGAGAPFRHLIYPVPEPGGLGIHLTLDLAGQARFGPDVEWVDFIDYAVDPARGERFYAAIRRYWPGLPDGVLVSAYSGIRPKTAAAGPSDFVVQGPKHTGHPGYISLYGIKSPGLTASLSISEHVAELAGIG